MANRLRLAARGQRLEMVPPKDMVALVEPMFEKREELQERLHKQFPQQNPLILKSALAGIMRKGASWDGDPGNDSRT